VPLRADGTRSRGREEKVEEKGKRKGKIRENRGK
jgi:hypothetical protein